MSKIPVVDVADLGLQNEEVNWSALGPIIKELDAAFSKAGVVYLKNHGIEEKSSEKIFQTSKDFFELPMEVKNENIQDPASYSGYMNCFNHGGLLQKNGNQALEIRECFDLQSSDNLFLAARAPEFLEAIKDVVPQMCRFTSRLLDCMSVAIGWEPNYLRKLHSHIFQGGDQNATTFRSLYYPSLANQDVRAGTVRFKEHKDIGILALILQDDMGGLQALVDNEWVDVTPIPGAVVVNLGALIEYWTCHRYKAPMHRVQVPDEELRRRCIRQSITLFVHPDNGVVVSPLDGSVVDGIASIVSPDHLKNKDLYKKMHNY